jgi:hypothetical protein
MIRLTLALAALLVAAGCTSRLPADATGAALAKNPDPKAPGPMQGPGGGLPKAVAKAK